MHNRRLLQSQRKRNYACMKLALPDGKFSNGNTLQKEDSLPSSLTYPQIHSSYEFKQTWKNIQGGPSALGKGYVDSKFEVAFSCKFIL